MFKPADRSYPPDVDPSELRHVVTFLKQTIGTDGSGASASWAPGSPPLTVYAKIAPIRASDVIKGGSDVSQVRIDVTIRYRPGILPNMRLLTPNGSQLVIEGIENVLDMNMWLILTCLGIGANG